MDSLYTRRAEPVGSQMNLPTGRSIGPSASSIIVKSLSHELTNPRYDHVEELNDYSASDPTVVITRRSEEHGRSGQDAQGNITLSGNHHSARLCDGDAGCRLCLGGAASLGRDPHDRPDWAHCR